MRGEPIRRIARALVATAGVHRQPPRYPLAAVLAPLIAWVASTALVWSVVYRPPVATFIHESPVGGALMPLVVAIVTYVPALLAARWARIALADAGVGWMTLLRAPALLAVVWSIGAAVQLGSALVTGDPIRISDGWRAAPENMLVVLGFQLFVIALAEEAVFRGWLMPQAYLRLRARWSEPVAVAVAMVGVGVVFTLMHLPMLLSHASGAVVPHLLRIEYLAIYFAVLYLRTGDLALAVALHALSNEPSPLLVSTVPVTAVFNAIFWVRIAIPPGVALSPRRGRIARWLLGPATRSAGPPPG